MTTKAIADIEGTNLGIRPVTLAKMTQYAVVDLDTDDIVYENPGTPMVYRVRTTAARHLQKRIDALVAAEVDDLRYAIRMADENIRRADSMGLRSQAQQTRRERTAMTGRLAAITATIGD